VLESGDPLPLFFVSIDSKGVGKAGFVSIHSKGVVERMVAGVDCKRVRGILDWGEERVRSRGGEGEKRRASHTAY